MSLFFWEDIRRTRPTEYGAYLVHYQEPMGRKRICVAWYSLQNEEFYPHEQIPEDMRIRHWARIPDLPREEKSEDEVD